MNVDIDGKLSREELDALRDYMDKQMKKLKKLAVSLLRWIASISYLLHIENSEQEIIILSVETPLHLCWSVFVLCFVIIEERAAAADSTATCSCHVRRWGGRSTQTAHSFSLHQLWSSHWCSTAPVRDFHYFCCRRTIFSLCRLQTATKSTRKSGYASHPVTPSLYDLRVGPNSPISKEVRLFLCLTGPVPRLVFVDNF